MFRNDCGQAIVRLPIDWSCFHLGEPSSVLKFLERVCLGIWLDLDLDDHATPFRNVVDFFV